MPAGILASILLGVTLVLAAAVAGLMAYHYAKARIRERRGFTFDPVTETVTEGPDGAAAVRAKSAEEIGQIRARIESLMAEQHMRVETQGQHLAQRIDDIRVHIDAQERHMDGIKSELRHEIRRRDGELEDLRGQLASALDAFWKTMPALMEGDGQPLALPQPGVPEAPSSPAPAPAAPPAPAPPQTPTPAPEPVAVAPEPAIETPIPTWTTAADITPRSASPEPVWADAASIAPGPDPFTGVAPRPAPVVMPPAPEDADDLTIIRGINSDMQARLYAAGIFHLDEVARWSRADARRIAGAVGVSEETIMHEWIFEAQSVLFDSYQRQMGRGSVTA
jgi:predicted flap endonuclease-1-like 5' DNA nuclease